MIILKTIFFIIAYFILFLCVGDKSSLVTAHVSEDGILTAHIETNNETYYIEVAVSSHEVIIVTLSLSFLSYLAS